MSKKEQKAQPEEFEVRDIRDVMAHDVYERVEGAPLEVNGRIVSLSFPNGSIIRFDERNNPSEVHIQLPNSQEKVLPLQNVSGVALSQNMVAFLQMRWNSQTGDQIIGIRASRGQGVEGMFVCAPQLLRGTLSKDINPH